MRNRHRILTAIAAIAAPATLALGLAGCATATSDNADDGVLRIVASTNVYGDIAATVGGDAVEVTSIIDNPDQDPHEFEASGRVQLELSRADVVIENGGGYDDFVDTMLSAAGNETAIVLNAVEISGKDADAEGFNEHVWYDYTTMAHLATAIADALGEVDSDGAADYAQNAAQFASDIDSLRADALEASTETSGIGVVITEPVPGYLLDALELVNLTPPEFTEAVEEDTDVPPALLQSVLDLIGDGSAKLVIYNTQTGGPQTDAVLDGATDNQVPAIGVTETLPDGTHYLEWQAGVLSEITSALAS